MKHITNDREKGKRVFTEYTKDDISKTDPSWKEDCDVNNIIKKFSKTGQISHLAKTRGQYADVSEYPDLLSAYQVAQQAQDAYLTLPALLRKRFTSPEQMIQFLQDPANNEEAIKLGLKVPRQTSDNKDAPIVKSGVKAKPPKEPKNEPKSKTDTSADD